MESPQLMGSVGISFPDENVDPKVKREKPWLLQYARAAFAAYGDTPFGSIGWRSRDKYEWVKTYAQGRQSTDRYKRILTPDQDPTNNTLVVDWSVLPIIPKFRRIALSLLEKQNYSIQIDPVDAFASTEIDAKLQAIKTKIQVKDALKDVGLDELTQSPLLTQEPGEPDDLDGLQVLELGIRHRTSMEAEQAVELTFDQNDFPEMRRQVIQDLFDYGVGVYKDYRDGNLVGTRRVDPRRLIISYCTYPDFRDLRYVGEIMECPVSQLIAMSNGELTKADIEFLYQYAVTYQWRTSQPVGNAYYGSYSDFWNKGKVQVLDLEIYSTDDIVREERIDKRGNVIFGKASFDDYNNKKDKYKRKQIQGGYRIKWVVGTDICFDYGRMYDMKRDPLNVARIKSSYHINACDFFDMKTFSRMEAIIPYADAIQLSYARLQHELNTAVPKGFMVDLSALEEVSLSGGGEKMTPRDILDLYFQRGVLVTRSTTFNGQTNRMKAVEELQGGVGSAIQEYWTLINQNIDMIRQTLGLNELTDGSTPNPKLLTTVANLAATGTNNALGDINNSDRFLTESLAESVIIRVQDIIKNGDGQDFEKSLGAGTVEFLKVSPEISKYTYGIQILDKPTAEEKAKLDELMKVALQSGQITIDDVIRMNNIQNLKQAELFLAYKVKKNNEKRQKEALEAQQQNGQIQQQSAMVAEQAKQQTAQLENQLQIQLVQAKAEMEAKLIQLRGEFELERERIAASGRVESSYVQAKERDTANIRDNKTKLLKENLDGKMGAIDIEADLKSTVEPLTQQGQELPINLNAFSFMPKGPQQQPQMQQQQPEAAPEEEGPATGIEALEQASA
jgi:hypothetical protein